MSCFDSYIEISQDVESSRSGLYASDLPGIDLELLDGIAKSTSEDYSDIWPTIYKRAKKNLVSDITKLLSDKFFVDLKLVSRETSQYKATRNESSGLAGITIEFILPKYARVHILSVEAKSFIDYATPGFEVTIFEDDADGDELYSVTSDISAGKNVVNIDQDFEVDKLFIAYDPTQFELYETENRYYAGIGNYDAIVCDHCFMDEYSAVVTQVNGGGLNVKFIIYCSVEKFVCENLKLFDQAFWYKLGEEITIERRFGNRLNEFTILTQERWEELTEFYKAQYQQDLKNTIDNSNITEDLICFNCKNTVRTETFLP